MVLHSIGMTEPVKLYILQDLDGGRNTIFEDGLTSNMPK